MADFRTAWDSENTRGDWIMRGASLGADADLETAVLISLFTHRRARPDDVLPDGAEDRRGWWADTDAEEGEIGSRLWLLHREKQSAQTRNRAVAYAREALQWLIDDGVARQVDVQAEWAELGRLDMQITVWRADGRAFERRFESVWQQIAGS